ncbi:MAG: competence/damage-inducible protein A [Candidatus Omnitrophica bacterium]|nr:competence/damage-inducible protein A [Candidatus Omnitrophota bacterium]
MRAEIIAIGTELLLGFTPNSDATTLGRVLAGLGIDCHRHVTVGDNPVRSKEAIRSALSRADLVITCGGLGPTVDDVTLEAIASASGKRLLLNRNVLRQIKARFARLKIRMPKANLRQALIPKGAIVLPNSVGTAPGLLLKLKRGLTPQLLVALPGPPAELIPMVERYLTPRLRRYAGKTVIRSRTLKTAGLTESEVDAKVRDILALRGKVTIGIYAHPGQVDLRITSKATGAAAADRLIRRMERRIRQRLKDLIYGADDESLESAVGKLLKGKRLTLAVAESCTGGLIQHRITEASGSSEYFRGGVVAYANALKEHPLKVPVKTIGRYGAVSPQTARAMAEGVRRMAGSDLGLSATGIAGPTGGSKLKPVGLVYVALSAPRQTQVERFLFSGDRATVKFKASQAALNLVRLFLLP